MKLTPWFPGSQKPDRIGVYQRRGSDFLFYISYSAWDGNVWNICCENAEEAMFEMDGYPSLYQDEEWRGLASPDGK